MNSGIYLISNLVNGKVYIGSSKNITKRKAQHFSDLRNGKHTNCYLQNAWNKYGGDFFQWEILLYCEIDHLVYWEDWFMNFFDSRNPKQGYNLWTARRHVISEETRMKISIAQKGKQYRLGSRVSEETKTKLSVANKGKTFSEETKRKLSTANKGKTFSEETRKKMSKAAKGRIAYNKGIPMSEEQKVKISEGRKRYWVERKMT